MTDTQTPQIAAELYQACKAAAEEINRTDPLRGFYALRKIDHISPTSSLEVLIRTGEDLAMIAELSQKNPYPPQIAPDAHLDDMGE